MTLQEALQGIGAILNQDTTLPTGTELTMQVNLVNQAISEWGHSYQWKQLRVNGFAPTFTVSMTSIGLPINFKILMSRPFDIALGTASSGANNDYEEIRPEDRFRKISTDRYCYTGGDRSVGYYMVINPPLASGVSLNFDYQMFPSSVVTLQDTIVIPAPHYVVKRVLSKIYEARSDTRFPTFKQEADDSLSRMMAEESALSGGFDNKMRVYYDTHNFRIGES